jgi:hypothetical protein
MPFEQYKNRPFFTLGITSSGSTTYALLLKFMALMSTSCKIYTLCLPTIFLFFFSNILSALGNDTTVVNFQVRAPELENKAFFNSSHFSNLALLFETYFTQEYFSILNEFQVIASQCPKNFYCIQDSSVPLPCPNGTFTRFNTSSSLEDCVSSQSDLCGVGYYWSSSVARCIQCTPGFYCRNSIQYPCEPGKISSKSNSFDCTLCENGFYANTSRTVCLQCDPGFYCENGLQLACSPGFFSSVREASRCIQCSSGNYANERRTSCVPCNPGNFCINGIQTSCPVSGYNNVQRSSSCFPCPNGSYTSVNRTQCVLCDQIGFFCINGQKFSCVSLGPDRFSNTSTGSSSCFQCTPGTYIQNTTVPTACTLCNPGHFCVNGSQQKCQFSTFSDLYGSTNCFQCSVGTYVTVSLAATSCEYCPKGYYCQNFTIKPCNYGLFTDILNSTACYQCPNGTYVQDLVASTLCQVCLPGFFCQNYSRSQCWPGSVSNTSFATTCTFCSAGTYHDQIQQNCFPCETGYFCINGSMQLCPSGYYSNQTSSSTCTLCPNVSFYIVKLAKNQPVQCLLCEPGKFCVNHIQYECKDYNAFSNAYGMSACVDCYDGGYLSDNFTSCNACEPGFYCPGKKILNSTKKKCLIGSFTWNYNSTYCSPCTMPGYFYNVTQSDCMICPKGYYCVNNMIKPCPRGSFAATQGLSECFTCKNGYYTSADNEQCILCQAGHYCVSGVMFPCPYSYYNPLEGQFQCTFCPLGSLAYHLDVARTLPCDPCPANYYCPSPQHKLSCPDGTFSTEGSTSVINCFCDQQFSCVFRKLIELQIVISLEEQGEFLLAFQKTNSSELINYLEKSSSFINNLRMAYAEMRQIDVSQVVFQSMSL